MSGLLREPHVLSSAALNTVSTTKRTATILTHPPGSISAFRPSLAPIPFVRSRAAHRYFAVAHNNRVNSDVKSVASLCLLPPVSRGDSFSKNYREHTWEHTWN